jgi:hypothetical protein
MAQVIFPSSPSINDTYTAAGKTWKWNGNAWELVDVLSEAFATHTADTSNPHQTTFSNLEDTTFSDLGDIQIPLYSGGTWYNEDVIYFEETVFSAFNAIVISATTISATTINADILNGSLDWDNINNRVSLTGITGNTLIDSFDSSIVDGCQWMYSVKDSPNAESGNIVGIWDVATTAITDTQYTTNEIGSTTGITFNLSLSGSDVYLTANVVSGNWNINLRRFTI